MADSNYVLIEFNTEEKYYNIRNYINNIIITGHWPIIAHIERYTNLIKSNDNVRDIIEMGAYVQVNGSSVLGERSSKTKRIIKKLMKENLVHFVATDSHDDKYRPPKIQKCAKYISKKFGEEFTRKLLVENPQKILLNQII
jgi:protein-tyrosine phosphatase